MLFNTMKNQAIKGIHPYYQVTPFQDGDYLCWEEFKIYGFGEEIEKGPMGNINYFTVPSGKILLNRDNTDIEVWVSATASQGVTATETPAGTEMPGIKDGNYIFTAFVPADTAKDIEVTYIKMETK